MNTTRSARVRALVAASIVVAVATACGSDDGDATDATTDTAMDAMAGDDTAMDDMDMDDMAMNMGDAEATPADDVEGADLARGEYVLLDTRPSGYDDVAGTAVIARSARGTTVTTEVSGLMPGVDYIAHVHAEPCSVNGGPHYQFDVGGDTVPPNEIHLAFTADGAGNGFMTAENDQVAGVEAVAFVVHPVEFLDNKIACVDFVDD